MARRTIAIPAALRRTRDVILAKRGRESVRTMPGSTPGTFGTVVDNPKLADSIASGAATAVVSAEAANGRAGRAANKGGINFLGRTARSHVDGSDQGRSGENKLEVGVCHSSLRGTGMIDTAGIQACATAGYWQPKVSDFRCKCFGLRRYDQLSRKSLPGVFGERGVAPFRLWEIRGVLCKELRPSKTQGVPPELTHRD
jgi:hypothetical protein